METSIGVVWGGVGVIIGAISGWLGAKARINSVEKKVETLGGSVRYVDTCEALHEAIGKRFDTVDGMQKEIRKDVKSLLKRPLGGAGVDTPSQRRAPFVTYDDD